MMQQSLFSFEQEEPPVIAVLEPAPATAPKASAALADRACATMVEPWVAMVKN